ncbi:MAG: NifB/NifX family molybdenum-iron cluster-binding protein [Bacteroidales bacterium]
MIKIAIPTKDNVVDNHFGHCEAYSIFTIDQNDKIIERELFPAPEGCGCKTDIASVLKAKGISVMLAGNMGQGALNILQNENIKVVRGCSGNVKEIVLSYLAGSITDSGIGCTEHEPHH